MQNKSYVFKTIFPKESVEAVMDAKVRVAMPVYWGGFKFSYQQVWFGPVEEFAKEAEIHSLPYIAPQIGELFDVVTPTKWWTNFK